MNILGIDHLLFGVDDIPRCAEWLMSFGLGDVASDRHGRRLAAADGSAIVLRDSKALHLPPAPTAGVAFRATRYTVADRHALAAIGKALARDRHIDQGPDGSLRTMDDAGFCIEFQCDTDAVIFRDGDRKKPARALVQVAYRVPDVERAVRFYVQRLGFLVRGPDLLRVPAGNTLVLFLQGAPGQPCIERIAFASREARDADVHGPLGCAIGWGEWAAARGLHDDRDGLVAHSLAGYRPQRHVCPFDCQTSNAHLL
ncbi:VOC family protein [Telluria mixta]|uniref:VOC family protein n=1 Tax=Telluria mixta TaxID=34071 RepID=A0ABT2C1D8_9BURK|nr:VOC family protein [Telluria mixta]MCS0631196.1 VOC family protein [Telluria mixta]WEM95735.1 VOC family protein [Telluria mixta]